MGEPPPTAGPDEARLEAYRRRIEEFEAMGLDADPLRKVLEEDPDDFERQAEAFLRRELTGEESRGDDAEAAEAAAPAAVAAAPARGAKSGPEVPPERPAEATARETAGKTAGALGTETAGKEAPPQPPAEELPAGEPAAPAEPPEEARESAAELEPAAFEEPAAAVAEPGPTKERVEAAAPAGSAGEPPDSLGAAASDPPRDAIEEAMMEELEEAIAEEEQEEEAAEEESATPARARSAPPPPPPLAGGDSLAMTGAPNVPAEPATAAGAKGAAPAAPAKKPPPPAAKKPPPPGAAKPAGPAAPGGPVRPVRVVAKVKAPPAGARPAATGEGPGASEVLPAAKKSRGVALAAVGIIAVLGLSYGLYILIANAAPVAVIDVGAGPFQAGDVISFSANGSSDPNGDALRFSWQFGDGGTANGPHVTHAYAHSGTYHVVLTATDPGDLTGLAERGVGVEAGSVTTPYYRYGDRLSAAVTGTSSVTATGSNPQPLGTFTASLPGLDTGTRTYSVWGIDLNYTGTQDRQIGPRSVSVADGFLRQQETFESRRNLDLGIHGAVDSSAPGEINYDGTSHIVQSDYLTLLSNDTVHRVSNQDTNVEIQNTNPPTALASQARLIEYPDLATAADQLYLETVYVGHAFSTEQNESGSFRAEGYEWAWRTEGSEVIAGQLTVAVNFSLAEPIHGSSFTTLYVKLWVSSASSFPLKEVYYIRSVEPGRTYESTFQSTAADTGTVGTSEIPYGNAAGSYPPPSASEFAPLDRVPLGGSPPSFSFNAEDAYMKAQQQPDFVSFLASNSQAYAVNGSYGLNAGNPRWVIDFDQNGSGETMRIVVEYDGSNYGNYTTGGQDNASLSASDIGPTVSIDYTVGMLSSEEQASALFPGGILSAVHGNFTIRTALPVPSLSFNAASAATRPDIDYALGVESRPSEATRISAYVDATTGQLSFSLSESGDSLP